jgi:predicted RND superfamily exporter protein
MMTSFTTSVGFFATNASDVTGIKLFGIFCGLLIVVDYILSVLLLSPVLCLYDRMMMGGSPSRFVTFQKSQVMVINPSSNPSSSSDVQERDEEVNEKVTVEKKKNFRDRFLGKYIEFLYEFR